jgi:hypothetical protein
MPSLRSILGGRVRKKSSTPTKRTANAPTRKPSKRPETGDGPDDDDGLFPAESLDDLGPAHLLSLRDVPQALRHARTSMFAPIPGVTVPRASSQTAADDETPAPGPALGLPSDRIAHILTYRRALPPVASVAHVAALLRDASATEREVDELVRLGAVRRLAVPGRGEQLVETEALAALAREALSQEGNRDLAERFAAWLCSAAPVEGANFTAKEVDALVRAGFLTSSNPIAESGSVFARPEDRTTLFSLATVARAASGSAAAVGGEGAVRNVGGDGAGRGALQRSLQGTQLAVPGNGTYLKLVSSALVHLTSLLAKAPFRESAETALRERWNGGIAGTTSQDSRRAARGEFGGVLAGRTRRWREFYGMNFEWILAEAVGAGVVEVFETGSVGRGVRLTT